ncbi:hypothetical protein F5X99DRAFT_405602 [Biscogniauxia marginata]|nr:hypothetical protein F5X99DRAFT_405602 [Biscogniauxia marginata]
MKTLLLLLLVAAAATTTTTQAFPQPPTNTTTSATSPTPTPTPTRWRLTCNDDMCQAMCQCDGGEQRVPSCHGNPWWCPNICGCVPEA